ncbi:MAG TPA: hypothetical protein VMS96_15000 [Terriglobales bacterium]|nr:hypothetical protein [Terriglobales bacterium]
MDEDSTENRVPEEIIGEGPARKLTRKERGRQIEARRRFIADIQKAANTKIETKKYGLDVAAILLSVGIAFILTEVVPALYWLGIVALYASCILLAYHLWVDLKPGQAVRIVAVLPLAFAAFISVTLVFVPAPIEPYVIADLGNYPKGTVIAPGVEWRDPEHYVDVRLSLTNSTANDYKDVDIQVNPDITVFQAAQLSGIPGVNLSLEGKPQAEMWLEGVDNEGKPFRFPAPVSINMDRPTGIRILCDRFPKHSTINLILVSAALNYGFPLAKQMFAPKRLPRTIHISGSYRVLGRTRSVDDTVRVEALQQQVPSIP